MTVDSSMADLGGPSLTMDEVMRIFQQFDMMSLWSQVENIITEVGGTADPDVVMLQLRDTPEYKERFKANEQRVKSGLSELTPAAYVQLEQQYKQIMEQSGLPDGFYRDRKDFEQWIATDNSPYEIQARIGLASQAVATADPNVKQALADYYGIDDAGLAAYFLDDKRATDLLNAQYGAAVASGSFKAQGMSLSKGLAEEIGAITGPNGVRETNQAASMVGDDRRAAANLNAIYGETLSEEDLTRSAFNLSGADQANQKKRKLASAERAAFAGGSGVQSGSLGKSSAGMI